METKMVSNLLVPMISKQFKLKNFSRQSIKTFDRKSRWLSDSQELQLPIGIWDACKLNPTYKELVELLQTHEFSDDEALKMLFKSIFNTPRREWIYNETKYLEDSKENASNEYNQPTSEQDEKIIFMWKTTKLKYEDLSLLLN